MANYSFKKFVLTPVLLSAAVFTVLTIPLTMLGSKPVTIYFQKEPVFYGKLVGQRWDYVTMAQARCLCYGDFSF